MSAHGRGRTAHAAVESDVSIETAGAVLEGNLVVPDGAAGLVLFAHGSGSSTFATVSEGRAAGGMRLRDVIVL